MSESPSKRARVADGGSGVSVTLALDCKSELGESPVWDAKMKRLHFVDIIGRKLHSFDPYSARSYDVSFPEDIGCCVPYQKKRVLVCGTSKIFQVDMGKEMDQRLPGFIAQVPESECEQVQLNPDEITVQPIPGFRFNDGKCDPEGRLFVGTMNKDWRNPKARKGKLFCIVDPPELKDEDDLDGTLHQYGPNPVLKPVMEEVTLSNGMAWGKSDPASDTFDLFYFIDSATQCVDCYMYNQEDGTIDLKSKKTVVHVPPLEDGGGVPDGMTIDSDGNLWVVLGEGGCVVQYDPKTDKELQRVKLPVQRPTACTFGGDDLEDLYVTSREEKGESPSPNAGGLFKLRVPGVKGLAPAYAWGHPRE
mmetsp:Transcript_38556/g.94846  ORF Transcript_38556/g.94846 Transcript_38556/m.94846 type:complete len:362 (-) Transcript_38556:121-1206(-)